VVYEASVATAISSTRADRVTLINSWVIHIIDVKDSW
jgi:hypothetical protein